uniref:Uncharacterized protein n=1 Tax=Chromera velia CCMP2878 TaxID=1169474 RepID=A0A0G4HB27_9ALVE|eukprot:Cvel_25855.t1-p1 / transcript=Cvel_25855.t1 / gene=Cvel_25855 / organism=Chromera_velia_CCMP2878 / gene_product=Ankyrin-2, putative / transcript_product=Ankyrin-2, putative / location=Cvel_scaffold2981:8644-14749(+) / protein_length=1387 / sequence_SO=supercontig / SO=protein_coding / is_pseudo=false
MVLLVCGSFGLLFACFFQLYVHVIGLEPSPWTLPSSETRKESVPSPQTAPLLRLLQPENQQDNPLHGAASTGELERLAQLLQDSPEDINARGLRDETPLMRAAGHGHPEAVSFLLERGADRRRRSTALHWAARNCSESAAEALIAGGAGVDFQAPSPSSVTPLIVAASSRCAPVASVLLRHGADPATLTPDSLTALHVAAARDSSVTVRVLLEGGVDVNALGGVSRKTAVLFCIDRGRSARGPPCGAETLRVLVHDFQADLGLPDREGRTAVQAATEGNRTDFLSVLLEADPSLVDSQIGTWKEFPLHLAAKRGFQEVAALLLRFGASIEASDSAGLTPFLVAAKHLQADMVTFLAENGASVTARDSAEETAMHFAVNARSDFEETARALMAAGLSVDAVGGKDPLTGRDMERPALVMAASFPGPTSNALWRVQTLLRLGADRWLTDANEWTAMHHAARQGHLEVLDLLFESPTGGEGDGRDPRNVRGGLGPLTRESELFSPLMVAINYRRSVDEIQGMIDRGCSVLDRDAKNRTTLHIAAEFNAASLIPVLIANGVDVDATGGYDEARGRAAGVTPLMVAARLGYTETLAALLEHGASVHREDVLFSPALQKASVWGNVHVVTELLDRGARIDAGGGWSEECACRLNKTALMSASHWGHYQTVNQLLERGAAIDLVDRLEQNCFHYAAMGAEKKEESRMSPYPIVIDVPMRHAASIGSNFALEMVALSNVQGETPIAISVRLGNLRSARALLRHHVQLLLETGKAESEHAAQLSIVEAKDGQGLSLLLKAAASGHFEMVLWLLSLGSDVRAEGIDGESALHLAVDGGHYAVVSALLESSEIYPDSADFSGGTAVHVAASRGSAALLTLLRDGGASLSSRRDDGASALLLAFRSGCLETAEVLLSTHASSDSDHADRILFSLITLMDPSVPPDSLEKIAGGARAALECQTEAGAGDRQASRDCVLSLAMSRVIEAARREGKSVRILRDEEENTESFDEESLALSSVTGRCFVEGLNPLRECASHGLIRSARLFLEHGADANGLSPCEFARQRGQQSQPAPLLLASAGGNEEVALELLERGAHHNVTGTVMCKSPFPQTIASRCPLHCAAAAKNTTLVRALLNKGASGDAQDANGRTALMEASLSGSVESVRALMDSGRAGEALRDFSSERLTALQYADMLAERDPAAAAPVQAFLLSREDPAFDECKEDPETRRKCGELDCEDLELGTFRRGRVRCTPKPGPTAWEQALFGDRSLVVYGQATLMALIILAAATIIWILPRTCVKRWKDLDPPMRIGPVLVFALQLNTLIGDWVFFSALCTLLNTEKEGRQRPVYNGKVISSALSSALLSSDRCLFSLLLRPLMEHMENAETTLASASQGALVEGGAT